MEHPKNRAIKLITALNMQTHPEGGHYCKTYESNTLIKAESLPSSFRGDRPISSAICFLLEGNQISALHRIKSDEIWHFYEGSALIISIISPTGTATHRRLGANIEIGEEFQVTVPAGSWFGAKLLNTDSYSFFGCTVSPGFYFEDFELGRRDNLLKLFPAHEEIINALTLRQSK